MALCLDGLTTLEGLCGWIGKVLDMFRIRPGDKNKRMNTKDTLSFKNLKEDVFLIYHVNNQGRRKNLC